MKVLQGGQFTEEKLNRNLSRQVRKEGLIRRNATESLKIYPFFWRPFRVIHWEISNQHSSTTKASLLDEQLAPLVSDPDERLLLWRPKYIGIPELEEQGNDFDQKEYELDSFITEILLHRRKAQKSVEEINPTLRRMQKDPKQFLSAFIPRIPTRLRKEEVLAEERRRSYSMLLALSLMTNSSDSDIIMDYRIGKRIHVGTIVACFRNLFTSETRLVFLETPGARTIDNALKSGRALTRLCQLNETCQKYINNVFDFS